MKYLKINEKVIPYDFEYKGLKCAIRDCGNSVFLNYRTYRTTPSTFLLHASNSQLLKLPMLNGYVGVPKEHLYFQKDYNSIHDINIHGGLTFADNFCPPNRRSSISKLWWLGFDTGHYMDIEEYKDENFVYEEVLRLAKQLYKIKK